MKDMGKAEYILGVKINKDCSRKPLSLSQKTSVSKILEHFNMRDCKSIDTVVVNDHNLSEEMWPTKKFDIQRRKQVPYLNAIGSLMYAMLCTRLDICYVVRLISRFQSNSRIKH